MNIGFCAPLLHCRMEILQVPDQLKRLVSSTGLLVVLAFIVRMICLYWDLHHFYESAVRDNLQFGGELGSIAASVAAGHGFSSPMRLVPSGPTALFAPIYPYFLGGIFKWLGTFSYPSSVLIRTIQCALSAFTCWPLYAIARKAFGKTVGTATAWIWVFFPGSIYFAVEWVWDTSIVALCLALVVAATLELRGSDRTDWWIGYGALWGIGAMINPSILAVLPFLAGVTVAQEPTKLTGTQMDNVTAGWDLLQLTQSNTSQSLVAVYQRPSNTISCPSCYLLVNSKAFSAGSIFGPP